MPPARPLQSAAELTKHIAGSQPRFGGDGSKSDNDIQSQTALIHEFVQKLEEFQGNYKLEEHGSGIRLDVGLAHGTLQ